MTSTTESRVMFTLRVPEIRIEVLAQYDFVGGHLDIVSGNWLMPHIQVQAICPSATRRLRNTSRLCMICPG
jgi:hypothetical protein